MRRLVVPPRAAALPGHPGPDFVDRFATSYAGCVPSFRGRSAAAFNSVNDRHTETM